MDDMRMISTLLDERPSERSVEEGRARLEREITSPRPRFSMPRWRIAVPVLATGTVAAVTAIAVGMSSGTTPRAPDGSDGSDGSVSAAPMSARTVLLSAASKVERASLAHGKYWHVVTQERFLMTSGKSQYDTSSQTGWWDAGPGREAWYAERGLGTRYLGRAPHGGPVITQESGKPRPERTTDSGPTGWTKVKVPGGHAFRLQEWGALTPPDVRRLPGDPQALKAFLARALKRLEKAEGGRVDPVEWLFSNAQKIGTTPASPKAIGATYRLLATDPGLRVVGQVTDPLGRKGTAIARQVVKGGQYEEWLVLDPATGRVLAHQDVRKPATVTGYHAIVSYGWTDTVPDYPLGKIG
ncbi:CU044_5270 family protein [Actinomadura fulvescens]|uniref:CU044_5270 family protein n=1 Tax=Actinomadura fulvescens TaxID=46160 RepID=A0ABN3QAJ1_9ACTN